MEKKILEIGTLLKTDKQGFLVKIANKNKIKGRWKDSVDYLVKQYLKKIGNDKIHSIWIRGSIAKGEAIENISDIDSFCLIKKEEDIDKAKVSEIKSEICKKFPFITKVEMSFIPIQNLLNESRYFGWRFTIKTQAVCVYGEDINDKIEDFEPSRILAGKIQENLRKRINQVKEKLKNDERKTKVFCSWIMKRILRQGFILVMDKEKAFTRDLYPCYKIFSKYYPEKEKEMKKVLKLAIYPTSDKKQINRILDDFGEWIIKESEEILG